MRYQRNLRRAAARGFTLTEVMVAITLSVFLLMGLFTILQQTRKTNTTTTGLSQLQDDERVAMTIITDTLQTAGYVPEANGAGASNFVVDTGGGFATALQVISSTAHSASNGVNVGERLTMRLVIGAGDSTILCNGKTPTTTVDLPVKEIFQIELSTTPPSAGTYQLICVPQDGSSGIPIVNNVVSLTFQWAVNSTSASSITPSNAVGPNTEGTAATGYGCPADAWQTTAQMQTPDWANVCEVKVDLVFINPLYQPSGQPIPTPGQQQYITFEKVVAIQSKAGVNVTNSTQT
jgi:type IV pilus assembly protein PilW